MWILCINCSGRNPGWISYVFQTVTVLKPRGEIFKGVRRDVERRDHSFSPWNFDTRVLYHTHVHSWIWTTATSRFPQDPPPHPVSWPMESLTPEGLPGHDQSSLLLESLPDHLPDTLSLDVASEFPVTIVLCSASSLGFSQPISKGCPQASAPSLFPPLTLPQPSSKCHLKTNYSLP